MSKADWPYVVNLGNSIIGVSVLAMPFCFKQCGILLGALLLLVSGFICLVSCNLLMKGAFAAKRRSYEFLALHVFGGAGKLAVEISIIGLLIGTCVAFHVIIGDLGPAIISRVLGLENSDSLRTGLMIFLGVFVALPLGLLKNVDSLSNISAVSLGFYCVFLVEVLTAAFPNLWSGLWVTKVEFWKPEGIFNCLPIFALSFGCHSQLFILVDALPEASVKRMFAIAKNAISLCTAFYLSIGCFGYIAFCTEEISGDILVNFRPTIFSESVKLGFVLSVAISFPLVIYPCRTAIHTLMCAKTLASEHYTGSLTIPEPQFKLITMVVVFGTLVIGIFVPNVEFVLAMTGSTMGSMICFIFPSVIYIKLMSMSKASNKSVAQIILFLGVTLLLASTYMTLNSQDKNQARQEAIIKQVQPDMKPAVEEPALPAILTEAPKKDKEPVNDKAPPDGDGVIKEEKKEVKDKEENPADNDFDHRHEPPNPHAPPDDVVVEEAAKKAEENVKKDEEEMKKAEQIEEEKQNNEEKDKKDLDNKDTEKAEDKDAKIAEGDTAQDKKPEVMEEALKKAEADRDQLLEELQKQREEQKEMIEQQKLLLEEMKQHKDVHKRDDGDAGLAKEDGSQKLQQQQQGQQGAQQQVQQGAQQQVQQGAQQQMQQGAQQQVQQGAQQVQQEGHQQAQQGAHQQVQQGAQQQQNGLGQQQNVPVQQQAEIQLGQLQGKQNPAQLQQAQQDAVQQQQVQQQQLLQKQLLQKQQLLQQQQQQQQQGGANQPPAVVQQQGAFQQQPQLVQQPKPIVQQHQAVPQQGAQQPVLQQQQQLPQQQQQPVINQQFVPQQAAQLLQQLNYQKQNLQGNAQNLQGNFDAQNLAQQQQKPINSQQQLQQDLQQPQHVQENRNFKDSVVLNKQNLQPKKAGVNLNTILQGTHDQRQVKRNQRSGNSQG